MPTKRLTILFDRYLSNVCTPEEKQELAELILSKEHDDGINELLESAWLTTTGESDMPEGKAESIFNSILAAETKVAPRVHRIHFRSSRWWAAAAVIIMMSAGSYFMFFNKGKQNDIVKNDDTIPHDVAAPKGTKAMITLADGRIVALDSVTSGTLAMQGNVNVIKNENGEIVYSGTNDAVLYNTLVNPKGSPVQSLTLADGTKVWMNAESTLKYFTSVGKVDRRVEITGECYFEVTHDATKPFIAKDINRGTVIQVLGTRFNVNTYADEPMVKVTLLEGSVKVTKGSSFGLLKPGLQAQVSQDIKVIDGVNMVEVMAWKNGYFQFTNADIGTVMRQVERWYDVQVVYEGEKPTGHYAGEVSRNVSAAEMLKVIKASGVNFRIEGKKIIVMK